MRKVGLNPDPVTHPRPILLQATMLIQLTGAQVEQSWVLVLLLLIPELKLAMSQTELWGLNE